MENLLSRKFIFAVLAIGLGFVLVLLDKATASDYLHFVEIIGGTYVIGNVATSVTDKFQDKIDK